MSWRRITVDGQPFRWTVSISGASRISGELNEKRLTVIVRPQARDGRRRSAVFHGFCVEDLFAGRRQNVVVRPATVAALIRRLGDGETLDHAEREFPDAVTAADPQDERSPRRAASGSCPTPAAPRSRPRSSRLAPTTPRWRGGSPPAR